MAIRRSQKRMNRSKVQRGRKERQEARKTLRRMHLESLEPRQLLAVGPQLAGIQPNDGEILRNGDIRKVAPRELVFQFQDGAAIDATTLDAIQVTRSGFDGEFSAASAISDLNTDGRVVFEFRAESLGQGGNGITIEFTQSDRGGAAAPTVEVEGRTIQVDLNSNVGNATRAGQLVDAINANPEARALMRARILRGSPNVSVGARPINYSPLVLDGANAASASSNFGTGTELQVTFSATQPGQQGNGIRLVFSSADLGAGQPPRFTVDQDGREISIVLNSRPGSETTARQLVDAINADADTSAVIMADVEVGDRDAVLTDQPVDFSLVLGGSSDVVLEPGALFVEDNGREVVFRFKENLPDDVYRVDVFGSGTTVLLNEEGEPFEDGENFALEFDLDLGAQVVSVVPQPIVRNPLSGRLEQRRHQVAVYFNDDNLAPGSAANRNFYRLVFTNETVENTDDLEFTPLSVEYDPELDRAVLSFASSLDELPGPAGAVGAGTFRLRIGDNEAAPLPPLVTELAADPGSSYDTAVNVGRNLQVLDGADGFVEGQVFTITDDSRGGATTTFVIAGDAAISIERAFTLGVPPAGGRLIGDGDTFTIDDGTADVTFEFDRGSSWDTDHFRIAINGQESAAQVAQKVANAIVASGLDVTTDLLAGARVHVGGEAGLAVSESGVLSLVESREIVPVIYDPAAVTDPDEMASVLAAAINGAAFGVTASTQTDAPAVDHPNAALQATTRIALTGAGDMALEVGFQGLRSGGLAGLVIRSEIASDSYRLEFPGTVEEPGHRDIPVQSHTTIPADTDPGITTRFYNFQENYGVDERNNPLTNAITENQKDRAREIFEIFGRYMGLQFVETPNLGFTIVTGDLRAIDPAVPTGPGGVLGLADPIMELAVMDAGELDWDDTFGGTDIPGAISWFEVAMQQIATLLGFGRTDELPGLTITGSEPLLDRGNTPENIYPGDHDIVHGQLLYRPDNVDIDLYRVDLPEAGLFTVETFAERQDNPSLLDTAVTLYRELRDVNGNVTGREVVARNDDYYSEDSYLQLRLDAGTYYVGVSASGNNVYDPVLPDSGLGGTSEGDYRLRLDFQADAGQTIVDTTGNPLDGDNDGLAGGQFNFWFRSQTEENTIYVDRTNQPAVGQPAPNGSLQNPFNNIQTALALARARGVDANGIGSLVRIVGNEGADGLLATPEDALAYEIGFHRVTGRPLRDGSTLEVPQGVTVMVDSGAVLKLRRARIGVGSSSPTVDRSGGALQLLGTPRVVLEDAAGGTSLATDMAGSILPGSVFLTSIHDNDIGIDTYVDGNEPDPDAGDWGGIVFRNDIDRADRDRKDAEREGMFLNSVNHGDFRYGGGDVLILGQPTPVSPVHMIDARPTVAYNHIRFSGDAGLSANPDSFEETNFHAAPFQNYATDPTLIATRFTSEYDRVGPDIHNNTLTDNSLNGLFLRIATPAAADLEQLTVAGRFDDIDVVHILQENLVIAGTPGGPLQETGAPPVSLITLTALAGGELAEGTYTYRLAFVDAAGNEGPLSAVTGPVELEAGEGSVRLRNLPPISAGFVARRLYRSIPGSANEYLLVAELDPTSTVFVDDGTSRGGQIRVFDPAEQMTNLRARLDGRLAIDPGTILKLDGARIETGIGAQLIAEGVDGNEVVFTSLQDDLYGFGGTFDTNNNSETPVQPVPGDWGGLFIGHVGTVSVDHAVVQYGGGVTRIEGTTAGFNPLEVHQATARIAHTDFRFNADGTGGQSGPERVGRGSNDDAVIFVRGAQPVLWENVLRDNDATAISINANALNAGLVGDLGRSTYPRTGLNDLVTAVDLVPAADDNQGPLVRGNRLGNNEVNGMRVRGATLTTQGVWDDTDIVHVLLDEQIVVPDFHTFGGLRLESSGTQSLVVKLQGENAGFTSLGRPLDIDDRIGGSLQIVGQPRFPVIITSFLDDTATAGLDVDGLPQGDTNGDAGGRGQDGLLPTGPEINNGTLIDNDVAPGIPGQFEIRPGDGGSVSLFNSGVSAQGNTQLFSNVDWIFDFTNFIDVGSDGGAFDLGTTNVTLPATLIGDDRVASEGTFMGANGTINWRVETFLLDGVGTVFNTLELSSDQPLGDLQFISYLDEDVEFVSDDLLYLVGTPGEADFRAFTLDDAERVGFAHAGFYEPGPELQNASYVGWAADQFPELLGAITGAGTMYTIPGNIDLVDLPLFTDPELGDVYGLNDVTTAFAWAVDPTATTARMGSFLELVPRNPTAGVGRGSPGDWQGIRVDEFSHDRNVDVATEREARDITSGPDTNQEIGDAQFLGALAPDQKSGDDNLRLGFEVHGFISRPSDVDVYSFNAEAGTEVWLDIDRTTHSLDTVVELLDGDGNVIALSDNSLAENADPDLLYNADAIPANHVNPLQKSVYEDKDFWGTNPRDAGMRVILPGTPDQLNTYHVRVRSSNLGPGDTPDKLLDPEQLNAGLTAGQYQLQLRLRERDEVPGTTVQYSDIRYSTNGIHVTGAPVHSPLAGEATEADGDNDSQGAAGVQDLGNLLNSDRGTLSVAGSIGDGTTNGNDVDFYRFEVTYDSVATAGGHFPVVFDLDYAGADLGRANTVLSIFDADGNLVFSGADSNIAEDRPGPLRGTNLDDLSRGTVGPLDPYIGTVELPVGEYFLAVSSNVQVPQELEQFLVPNPSNPLLRLEPVNSLARIAEDHLDFGGGSTAVLPEVPVLIEPEGIVPFHLGDVNLFVSRDTGAPNSSQVLTVNPFTGTAQTSVGVQNRDIGDLAMRQDGNLFSFTLDLEGNFPTCFPGPESVCPATSDAEAGNFIQIDTGTGAVTLIGDDGIQTFNDDPANPGTAVVSNPVGGNRVGHGIHFEAVAFANPALPSINDPLSLYAIGNRPLGVIAPGVDAVENILYRFDRNTGVATSSPQGDRGGNARVNGAGTQIVERGALLTGADPMDPDGSVLVGAEATIVDPRFGTTVNIDDGMIFTIDHDGIPATPGITFEFNSGPDVFFEHDPDNGIFVQDGDFFTLGVRGFEFNTGAVVVVSGANGASFNDGDLLTMTDNAGIVRTFEFDRDNDVAGTNVPIPFTFAMSQMVVVQQVLSAINGVPNFNVLAEVPAGSNRITLRNDSAFDSVSFQPMGPNGPGIEIEGDSMFGLTAIPAEETFTREEFADAILRTFNGDPGPPFTPGVPGITASVDGVRLNFSGAEEGDFASGMSNPNVFTDRMNDGMVTTGNIGINFLAADSARDIARRITAALNSFVPLPPDMQTIEATQDGTLVNLAPPSIAAGPNTSPIQIAGAAPGGIITGATFLGTRMFAVTDTGGLFQVLNYDTPFASVDYIESSAADLLGINFQGLTAGPPTVENGAYADMLFAITGTGRLYAFNTAGELQGVFVDGASSIQTDLPNANGLAFSTSDQSLWSVGTFGRENDPGHGLNPTFDGSRFPGTNGGLSLHFGRGSASNYDVPGGTHGVVESRPFSLAAYSSDDQPVLYFNYYLDTENQNSNLLDNEIMRDAFRVYVVTDDGQAHLVATNNSERGPFDNDDEFDDPDPDDAIVADVQELFDVGDNGAPDSWRQARVPLGTFAGLDNLRLRFDFNTAGDANLGDPLTVGEELRAIDGSRLRDGETFEIDDTLFEFDLGYTLIAPTGAALTDGDTFRIGGDVFEFDDDGDVTSGNIAVPFDASQSAATVAATMEDLILANFVRDTTMVSLTERNDTLDMATDSGLIGGFQLLQGNGQIGNNPNLVTPVDRGRDVDMLSMELNARDRLMITVDSSASPLLDTIVRLFDSEGNELALNDDGTPPDGSVADSYLDFTVPSAGTYYLGISGFGNATYDPTVEASGTSNVTGSFPGNTSYNLRVEVSNGAGVTRREGNRLTLPDATDVSVTSAALILDGAPGTSGAPVSIHPGMSDVEVAQVIRQSIADVFAGGNAQAVKIAREVINVIGHTVTDPGPLGLTDFQWGDVFGGFNSNQRGQDNAHEGVYVDDIIIGFAERGEMATGTVGNSAFSTNPLVSPSEILVGPYQVEVRRGAQYGTTVGPFLQLDRAFDTNDRLAQQQTLIAPRADEIAHRQTFTLSDGVDQVTFQYIDVNLGEGADPGNFAIPFDPSEFDSTPEPDFLLAQRIRDAINSPAVQAVLEITAASSDGRVTGPSQSSRINLFGNVVTQLLSPTLVITGTSENANELRDALLNGSDQLLPVGDAFFDGSSVSAGFFEGGFSSIGIESGIVLSTGSVFSAEGPNQDDFSSNLASEVGDEDLDAEFGLVTTDRTVLEFTVNLPAGGDIEFDFVFASEEYNESVNTDFNDVFAFFIEGDGLAKENLAVLPDGLTPVSVNTINGGGPTFGDDPTNPQFYTNNDLDDDGLFLDRFGHDGFTDVLTARKTGLAPGQYTIKLAISDVSPADLADQLADSAVFIQPLQVTAPGTIDGIEGIRFDDVGDRNLEREQGQLILKNNRISDVLEVGILVEPGDRDVSDIAPLAGVLPHSGPVRNLRELNNEMLVPGVTITNNIVDGAGSAGIRFAGEVPVAGTQEGPVPFGRIINNTVVSSGVGVQVADNASPTLLNNVVVRSGVGVQVDPTSSTTIVSGTVYTNNTVDFDTGTIGAGDAPFFVPNADTLFVDADAGNFYPAAGSPLIDSAVDSLQDRSSLLRVKNPLGIAPSPVLAPDYDALGQKRIDDRDVDPTGGQGRNVFKDRGAIDRADFFGPSAVLVGPRDNDAAGNDLNAQETFVEVNAILDRFSIQLLDGVAPTESENGSGVADSTVTADKVTVFRDGERLVLGEDYRFAYDQVSNVIHLVPIAGIWAPDHEYTITLANDDSFVIFTPDVETVMDGDQFDVTDDEGNTELFEFESGYTLQVPQTFTLEVPKAGGSAISDGETFVVQDGLTTVTFEFDRNGVVGGNTEVIEYQTGDTLDVLSAAIVDALDGAGVRLDPVYLGGGLIHMGSQAFHSVDVAGSSLGLEGTAGGVADGDTFLVDDGLTTRVVFEFDEDGRLSDAGNEEIDFEFSDTHEQIAERIVAAIRAAGLNLNPRHLGDGLVQVGGTLLTTLDASASNLIQTGQGGVQPAFGLRIPTVAGEIDGVTDGETFTISDGTRTVRFELDTDSVATPGNQVISFDEDATTGELADAIVAAIELADIGLDPVHLGGGIIELGGDDSYSLGLAGTSLTQVGVPGEPAATPVPFIPSAELFGTEDLAAAIAAAINASQTLEGVTATVIGQDVVIRGVAEVNGLDTDDDTDDTSGVIDLAGIADLAGNALKPNRVDGQTIFTILVGQGLDYGDAPDPEFPTLQASGGASHQIVPGFTLGDLIDSEFDGQPTPDASGDGPSDDGISFTRAVYPGYETTLRVTANGIGAGRAGFLDAWIDFNNDGFWDASEQIADSVPLNNGVTFLDFDVPIGSFVGEVVGRFRLSSTGGLETTGFAADGEVEDHLVTIAGNPWQNPRIQYDVNDDGKVTPIDVLILINRLNTTGAGPLDPAAADPPPYLDVNGDGFLAPADANDVITFINAQVGNLGAGEGETGEGEAGGQLPARLLSEPLDVLADPQGSLASGRDSAAPRRDIPLSLPPRLSPGQLEGLERAGQRRGPWPTTPSAGTALPTEQDDRPYRPSSLEQLLDELALDSLPWEDDDPRDAFFARY